MKPLPPVTPTRISNSSRANGSGPGAGQRLLERGQHVAGIVLGHRRRDGEADVPGADVLGSGQRAVGVGREYRLPVQGRVIDLAAKADVEALAQVLLEG